jgi:O-antigen/teichoic acid export membrane protein
MVGPFIILLPGIIASGCISVLLQYFNGTGKSSIQVLIFLIVLLVQAILLFVINKNLTTILASFVFSIAMILACTYTIKLFIRDTQFKWNDLVIKKSDVSIIASLISSKLKRKAIT